MSFNAAYLLLAIFVITFLVPSAESHGALVFPNARNTDAPPSLMDWNAGNEGKNLLSFRLFFSLIHAAGPKEGGWNPETTNACGHPAFEAPGAVQNHFQMGQKIKVRIAITGNEIPCLFVVSSESIR